MHVSRRWSCLILLLMCTFSVWMSFFLYKLFAIQKISVILEDFYNLFISKRFERKVKIEVTNWQPCLFLRISASCCQCLSSWYKSSNKNRKHIKLVVFFILNILMLLYMLSSIIISNHKASLWQRENVYCILSSTIIR